MRDRGDRDRGYSYDTGRGTSEQVAAKERTLEQAATQRVYLLRMEIEAAEMRVAKLSAIVQREAWRTQHASLRVAQATLAAKLEGRAADAKASERAQAHFIAATTKLGDIATALQSAQQPRRPVPPVTGEEAIEASIIDRSAAPENLLAWVAELDASERRALAGRVESVGGGSVDRKDGFAVALANYFGDTHVRSQCADIRSKFLKVAKNPRRSNCADYEKARAPADTTGNAWAGERGAAGGGAGVAAPTSRNAATVAAAGASPSALARPAAPGPMQAKTAIPNPPNPGVSASHQPMTSDPHGTADIASPTGAPPIQRHKKSEGAPKQRHILYKIPITKPMTGEELKVAAHIQVFGAVVASDWHNIKDRYTAADNPVEILVDVELFRRGRGLANAARGIATEVTGAVVGADARAKDFQAAPASDEKTALLAEVDRRYYASSQVEAGTKIKPGELGRAELWRTIRDEVLFQSAYIANLPEKVKALVRVSITGRELTPAGYDQLFRIAKKIESLPPGQAADCASKVTGSTSDLDRFETTIERYRSGVAARAQEDKERTAVQNKLVGLEEVYKRYRQYRATPAEATPPGMAEQLEQQLRRCGFSSIAELTSYISRFEQAFEDGAAAITIDILAKYAGKLHRESQRYQDPEVVKDLHGKLGGFRAQYQELDERSKIYAQAIWKAQHEPDAEVRRLPGNGGVPAKPPMRERVEAKQKAEAAKVNAESQIKDLSKDYPIFAEDELPIDKRLDEVALAQASEAELAGVLQAHIAHRQSAVAEARGQLEGKHELVYKMGKLMPTFYAQMGIQPGSIHGQIIQDKMHSDAIAKVVTGIVIAIVTVALTVVSLGTATPAVLAAGASIGAAGISTYLAYDEYQQYTEDHAIAEGVPQGTPCDLPSRRAPVFRTGARARRRNVPAPPRQAPRAPTCS